MTYISGDDVDILLREPAVESIMSSLWNVCQQWFNRAINCNQ